MPNPDSLQRNSPLLAHRAAVMIAANLFACTVHEAGTEEQKRRLIPPSIRGESKWCLLYSEPGAGSDLAGLRTRAERDGDEWVINGQKVWTSFAKTADYGMLVARTDWNVPKHQGISFFMLPMDQPGVEVRPIHQITGESEFNEVFIEDARVPADNLIGELNARVVGAADRARLRATVHGRYGPHRQGRQAAAGRKGQCAGRIGARSRTAGRSLHSSADRPRRRAGRGQPVEHPAVEGRDRSCASRRR